MFPIEFLRHSATATPDAIAAVDGAQNLTYRTLTERSDALGAGLQALAGRPRPVVAILGPNSLEMLVALMAIHASGSVLVPLNGRNAKAELDAQILRVRPDLMIVHKDYLEKFTADTTPTLVLGADADDPHSALSLEQEYRGQRPEWQAGLADINGIKFTGGSSGTPKGVMQSFRCINTLVINVLLSYQLHDRERYLCVAPMTHGAGAMILPTLARGGCVVMTANPKPGNVLDLMERERITMTWMPPTMLYTLIDEQKARPRNLSSLAHLIWSAAPASPARLKEAQQVFGPVVETMYGQTEAPLIVTVARASDLSDTRRLTTVGRVSPLAEVAVLGPDGRRMAPGQLGEVCIRGDLVMNGYLDMPEETAKTIRDGWLHTGDGGVFDEEGFLYLKDRLRDVVISGGFNVYPSDVEAILAQHPAVSEVVVFGMPDEHWGERVEATLELRTGHTATPDELIAFCKERLGSVKTPKRVHITQSLPRSPVGKVQRREARESAMQA